MRNKDKKCKISAILHFFSYEGDFLVWLHVQMGNERLEKYPPDILKDRNVRELHGK